MAATAVVASLMLGGLSPPVLAAALSQGYQADGGVTVGSLVSGESNKNAVVPADTTNSNGLLGVAVAAKTSALAINEQSPLVQVATSGTAQVFVSDINGAVAAGDQIAPSPIKGIGMKATDSGKVVGVAQTGFSAAKALTTTTVKTADGASHQVHIGTIPVQLQVVLYAPPTKTAVPAYLQVFVQTVTGKSATVGRLVLVGVILVSAILVVAFLMFAAVRGAVVAIGRNPLAKTSIYRGMLQAAVVSIVILAAAVGGAFIVLRY